MDSVLTISFYSTVNEHSENERNVASEIWKTKSPSYKKPRYPCKPTTNN